MNKITPLNAFGEMLMPSGLGEDIYKELDKLPDEKEEHPVGIENMSCECRKALRYNIKCFNYAR